MNSLSTSSIRQRVKRLEQALKRVVRSSDPYTSERWYLVPQQERDLVIARTVKWVAEFQREGDAICEVCRKAREKLKRAQVLRELLLLHEQVLDRDWDYKTNRDIRFELQVYEI